MGTVKINSGSGNQVTVNAPGEPTSVTINQSPTVIGEVVLSASSGLSKAFNSGASTNFDLVSISEYTKVKIAGQVDRVRFNITSLPTGTFTQFHIRVWRKESGTYDLVGMVDIDKADIVAGANDHVNSSPFSVEVGDYVGIGISGQLSNSILKVARGANGVSKFNTTYPNSSTNMNWDGATSSTVYYKIQLVADNQAYISERRGVAIGDSTVSDLFSGSTACTSIADFLLNNAQLEAGYQCLSIATPGDTISQQRTAWNAVSNPSQYSWVVLQVGLNDVNPAVSLATTLSAYQGLVDDIRADAPSIKIIVSTMTPGKGAWPTRYPGSEAAAQVKYLAMNESIMGDGVSPITGVDYRFDNSTVLLTDGSGNLKAEYDIGDGIHENDLARTDICPFWTTAIRSFGFL